MQEMQEKKVNAGKKGCQCRKKRLKANASQQHK
jgi:hypothetical protein